MLFFPFVLFGTVIGDVISELGNNNDLEKRRKQIKEKLIVPIGFVSVGLTIFGILFKFPNFLFRGSFSWIVHTIGIDLLILLGLIVLEEFHILKTRKKYRVFFYFSYYSFTVYLGHNFLYFIFYRSLDAIQIWIASIITFFIFWAILRQIYKVWGWKASLKAVLGRLSFNIAKKIEEKINK